MARVPGMSTVPVAAEVDAALRAALGDLSTGRVVVGFSGGGDSTALLAALATAAGRWLRLPVRAFHFDHGLHPDSREWVAHCRRICAGLGIPLAVAAADGVPPSGASIEAWAREQRYAALAREAAAGDVLLTAHHQDDLAETLLLMMLRGSGPHGLAGIAPRRPLGAGELRRPLLDLPRATLEAFLAGTGLPWLVDPANADPRYDRSFVRHSLLPSLRERWPAATANLARVAAHQRVAVEVLDEYADAAFDEPAREEDRLRIAPLLALPPARRALVLRRWLHRCAGAAPDAATLARILREVVGARPGAMPRMRVCGGELRRHAGCLYWLRRCPPSPLSGPVAWLPHAELVLPGGTLTAVAASGRGLRASSIAGLTLTVRARRGGECLRPAGTPCRRPVKHLLQEAQVPPWLRPLLPFVYAGETLVAVGGLAIASEFAAAPGEAGFAIEWRWSTGGA